MAKNFNLGQLSDQEVKQLKVFKTVVDCGGFAAAETQLNISRPTISTHIANLESRFNVILCKRGRGGFALTEEGTVIYEQTEKLLDMLEEFRNTINNLSAQPSGILRIGISDTFGTDERCKLPAIIQGFGCIAADVELRISVHQMATMERQILNDTLDIGLIPYHRKLDGLSYIHLFTDQCFLYCSKRNPLFIMPEAQLSDDIINAAPLVHAGLKPHEEVHQQLSEMNLAGVSYHYESRIAMLMSGRYIGFLPETVARPYVVAGELRTLAASRKRFLLGAAAISKKTAQTNRARDLFLQSIRDQFELNEGSAPY